MTDSLAPLLADGVIDEVLARVKSGKEADIFLVQHAGEIVAAKVYKDRNTRSFHNNAAYREGRSVRSSRTQRAMAKGTRFGRQAQEDAWKAKEAEALEKLFAAGVRVPKPYLFYEGVLLMEAVIDAEGHPAPRLIDAAIDPTLAPSLYADIRKQTVSMLACDLIHGDLSPYNILLAWNGPTLIDFPQVVGAAHNSQAEHFFRRDIETVRTFFASIAPSLRAHAHDAREIWRSYVRRELTADFVPEQTREPVQHRPPKSAAKLHRGNAGGPRSSSHRGAPGGQSRQPGASPVVSYRGEPQRQEVSKPERSGPPAHPRRRRRRRGPRGGGRGA